MKFIYNSSFKINIPTVPFKSRNIGVQRVVPSQIKDGFTSNPLYEKFGTSSEIEAVSKSNHRIRDILKEHDIPIRLNMEELERLKNGHMKETRIVAAKIYSSLPDELKKKVNVIELQEAAMLHDYGKVLIPKEILNKRGKLTEKEQEIMELHSELGSELLRDSGICSKTLDLIKYHHQNLNKNGYPKMDKDIDFDLNLQILSAADKYTALREKRSYKNPLGKYEALEIIAKDVNNGELSQDVYTALVRSV